ncbi:uncharacterized protein LOC123294885 [Chrysoperla carnea]|uniref:uncharacterized protein LOC123294885 n=1 Tax=Chrysoperla carnea TaxID=189513 RepID=UPI001D076932|nr:uncharacterized protein LOC123294885 [Chrysoperla carnea]
MAEERYKCPECRCECPKCSECRAKCPKCKCNVPPTTYSECNCECIECKNDYDQGSEAGLGTNLRQMARFALFSTLAGSSLVFLDSQQAGSFEKSATNKFLKDTGLNKLRAVLKIPYVMNQGGRLIHRATSISLKSVMRFLTPYIKFFFNDIFVILKSALYDIATFVSKNPTVVSLALVTVIAALVIQALLIIFPAVGNAVAGGINALARLFKNEEEPSLVKTKKVKNR